MTSPSSSFCRLPCEPQFSDGSRLEQVLQFLENLRFTEDELDCGAKTLWSGISRSAGRLRFTGEVHAMPEGTLFFSDEPILRVTAPIAEAQLVESRIINLLHFQTLVTSKAARVVLTAPGKLLVDFGMRRAHGAEAALLAARASYIAGFSGTATVAVAWLRYSRVRHHGAFLRAGARYGGACLYAFRPLPAGKRDAAH
jgi:nicotinate phosphoribosyltransferase